MHIVEFASGTLRFLEQVPKAPPKPGFIWIYLDRETLQQELPQLQEAAQRLGGSALLDLHVQDLLSAAHPSNYDYTSIYDVVVFRRLATAREVDVELNGKAASAGPNTLAAFERIRTRAVGFATFDHLLISVHPSGCFTARSFIERYLADAVQSDGVVVVSRSRLPASPSDLMLRMINVMVDSYLELRKDLSAEMDRWQQELPRLLERAGTGAGEGSITGIFTVLVEGDDHNEPISDAVRAILDGHIVMERPIAERGRYPAINVLKSVSRSMPRAADPAYLEVLAHARRVMSTYADMEELIRLGAYRPGSSPEVDEAIALHGPLEAFLGQDREESTGLAEGYRMLEQILAGPAPKP